MRPRLLLALAGICFCYSCAAPHAELDGTGRALAYLDPSRDFGHMASFRRLVALDEGTRKYEMARIEYLLERMLLSHYNFVRAGTSYNNARATAFLRWKHMRNRDRVFTGEDFIDYVASRSKLEGTPYLLKTPDDHYYKLRTVLYNELDLLDQALKKHIEKRREQAALEAATNLDTGPPVEPLKGMTTKRGSEALLVAGAEAPAHVEDGVKNGDGEAETRQDAYGTLT